jgi:hypothetical protein
VVNALLSSEYQEHGTPCEIVEAARRVMGGIELDPASSASANARVRADRFLDKYSDSLAISWKAASALINPPGSTWAPKNMDWTIQELEFALMGSSGSEQEKLGAELQKAIARQEDRSRILNQFELVRQLSWYQQNPTKSMALTFSKKARYEWSCGNLEQAIFVLFNASAASQIPELCYGNFPVCWTVKGAESACINGLGRVKYVDSNGNPGEAPTQPSAFIYLPPADSRGLFCRYAVERFLEEFAAFGRCGRFEVGGL